MEKNISYITKFEFYESVYLKSLLKESINKVTNYIDLIGIDNISLYTDIKLSEIEDMKFYYNNILVNRDEIKVNSIKEDTIYKLDYKELKELLNIINLIRKYSSNNTILDNEFILIKRIIKLKEDLVLKEIINLSEMELEDYYVLLSNTNHIDLEYYADNCDVDIDDLDEQVLFNRYHKRSLRRQSI